MKAMTVAMTVAAAVLSAGCAPSYLMTRNIPVLGLDQASKSECPKGERVYYYRAEDVAICMPDVMVAYTHCVTELTVSTSTSNTGSLTSLDIGKALDKVEGVKLSDDQKRDITKAFEAGGLIGEARAKAIEACLSITKDVYSGKVASDISDAKSLFSSQKKE